MQELTILTCVDQNNNLFSSYKALSMVKLCVFSRILNSDEFIQIIWKTTRSDCMIQRDR